MRCPVRHNVQTLCVAVGVSIAARSAYLASVFAHLETTNAGMSVEVLVLRVAVVVSPIVVTIVTI